MPTYSYSVIRASSIRHIFRPGSFRMQVALGDIGFDVDMAEAIVRRALGPPTTTEAGPLTTVAIARQEIVDRINAVLIILHIGGLSPESTKYWEDRLEMHRQELAEFDRYYGTG